ncbi:hypothetical protein [Acinetobacter phage AbTZA1]|uniref:Protector from prophage-induced early lysis n=1 Tax=Acinetobacter phage AbTZA1 TaxID=2500827 RepID=A0A3Q9R705_9CAUD|nr:RIIA lysis inhibitor [Acinetobacter phage AbTZA1]AZU98529.1 hypothetical protein [Acinetobacter phage AbTZA1]
MKFNEQHETILGNSSDAHTFTISTSAKAFQILSSGIYKNKIRAVVREVICNALDAHRLINSSEKFIIKAPTELDPRFVVRDFGPGLSHDDMITIYTQYFKSLKTEDGNQIGGFGLGAKSPFSYTDTFNVTSYHEGIVRIYTAALSNGEPQLMKVFEGPFEDGDRNGIEVTVPVKLDDIGIWQIELRYILTPFDPATFEIRGTSLDIKHLCDYETYTQYPEMFLTSSNQYTNPPGVYAICGNIVYPLDGTPGMKCSWLRATASVVYVHFDINELMPQPSREQLQMDEFTVKNICAKVNKLNNDLMEKDLNDLRKIQYARPLVRALNKLPSAKFQAIERDKIEFLDGMDTDKLYSSVKVVNSLKLTNMLSRARVYTVDPYTPKIKKVVDNISVWRRFKVSEVRLSELVEYSRPEITFLVDEGLTIKKLKDTIRAIAMSSDAKYPKTSTEIIVVRKDIPGEIELIDVFKDIYEGDTVQVLTTSELEPIRKELEENAKANSPKTPREKRPASPNASLVKFDHATKRYKTEDLYLTSTEIAELSGLCIGSYNNDPTSLSAEFKFVDGVDLHRIKTLAKTFAVSEYYIVRPAIYKRVLANKNLRCMIEFIFANVTKLVDNFNVDEYCYVSTGVKIHDNLLSNKKLHKIYGSIGGAYTPEFIEFNNTIQLARNIRVNYETPAQSEFIKSLNSYHNNMDAAKEVFEKFREDLVKKHPMVSYILKTSYGIGDDIADDIIKTLGV